MKSESAVHRGANCQTEQEYVSLVRAREREKRKKEEAHAHVFRFGSDTDFIMGERGREAGEEV